MYGTRTRGKVEEYGSEGANSHLGHQCREWKMGGEQDSGQVIKNRLEVIDLYSTSGKRHGQW